MFMRSWDACYHNFQMAIIKIRNNNPPSISTYLFISSDNLQLCNFRTLPYLFPQNAGLILFLFDSNNPIINED